MKKSNRAQKISKCSNLYEFFWEARELCPSELLTLKQYLQYSFFMCKKFATKLSYVYSIYIEVKLFGWQQILLLHLLQICQVVKHHIYEDNKRGDFIRVTFAHRHDTFQPTPERFDPD